MAFQSGTVLPVQRTHRVNLVFLTALGPPCVSQSMMPIIDEARVPPTPVDLTRSPVLYLVHRVPYPPDKGDRIRAFHLLRWLAARATVHLACLADEPIEEATLAALHNHCARVAIVPIAGARRWARALGSVARGRTVTEGAFDSPALRKILRRWAGETQFQVALASASSLVPYLRMPELREVPAVVDVVDVDSQKWLDYAAVGRGPRAWLYRLEGHRLRRLERSLSSWARAVTLVSKAEAELYRQSVAEGPIHAIVNGVDLDGFRPTPHDDQQGCVFVGALDYRPNIDGADWFCREVWPRLRRFQPDATVRLVGRRPAPAVRILSELPGVEVVGQVPDVRPYLAAAAVAIVPLRIARGVQNKVLEALAMGKGVVASPEALTGLGAEPGIHLLVASTPREWIDAVSRLWSDVDLRRRLGTEGRRFVETNHHWEHCLDPFSALMDLPAGHGLDAPPFVFDNNSQLFGLSSHGGR